MPNIIFKNSIYKKELADKAILHYNQMENHYKKEIEFSYSNSKIYYEDFNPIYNNHIIPNIQIVDTDTVSALFMIKNTFNNIGILNFASYKHPGGMFLRGSTAQEEALCHESILYNVLVKYNDTYYKSNKENSKIVGDLYSNRGIYSPNVIFFHNNEIYNKTNIITVAAPNYRNKTFIDKIENTEALNSRIKFILDIAENNKLETLILGAFGCGVFRQDPNEVANIFKNYLLSGNYSFTNIIFAIPYGENYKAFSKILGNNLFGFFIE